MIPSSSDVYKGILYGDMRVNLQRYPNVNVRIDACFLPFRDRVFSEIEASEGSEHFKGPYRVLREFKKGTRKRGSYHYYRAK